MVLMRAFSSLIRLSASSWKSTEIWCSRTVHRRDRNCSDPCVFDVISPTPQHRREGACHGHVMMRRYRWRYSGGVQTWYIHRVGHDWMVFTDVGRFSSIQWRRCERVENTRLRDIWKVKLVWDFCTLRIDGSSIVQGFCRVVWNIERVFVSINCVVDRVICLHYIVLIVRRCHALWHRQ